MDIMKIEKRAHLELGERGPVRVIMAGCGGTGSFLMLHLSRLAYHMKEARRNLSIELYDPDVIESKNIGRQNFAPAEIGQPKAIALMRRYNLAFGLDIVAHVEPYPTRGIVWGNTLTVVIGCVDNAAGRNSIMSSIPDNNALKVWWLDCGNHEHSGQVLLGNRKSSRLQFSPLGFCTAIPLPGIQHPELLEPEPEQKQAESCAELTLRDAQSLMINQQVAGVASQYVYRMVMTKLDIYATYIDLISGSMRSVGIVAPKKQKKGAAE